MKPGTKKVVKDMVYIILSIAVIIYLAYMSDPEITPTDSNLRIWMTVAGVAAFGVLIFNGMKFSGDWEDNVKSKTRKNENK